MPKTPDQHRSIGVPEIKREQQPRWLRWTEGFEGIWLLLEILGCFLHW